VVAPRAAVRRVAASRSTVGLRAPALRLLAGAQRSIAIGLWHGGWARDRRYGNTETVKFVPVPRRYASYQKTHEPWRVVNIRPRSVSSGREQPTIQFVFEYLPGLRDSLLSKHCDPRREPGSENRGVRCAGCSEAPTLYSRAFDGPYNLRRSESHATRTLSLHPRSPPSAIRKELDRHTCCYRLSSVCCLSALDSNS
jgi:hypothetical protein